MQFLFPFVLFGLVAVAIPVLIHLFNFRKPKRVFFTNVRFLRELKLESKRRSQLKHLLVLCMRLLAFASLIFAFAMPVLKRGDEPLRKGKPLVVIYLDNSFSMQSHGAEGVLFEQAVRKGAEVAAFYGPADEFYLITNDFSPKFSHLVNQSDLLELITTVQLTPVSRSADEIFERVADIRRRYPSRNVVCYLISDFQQSTLAMQQSAPDTTTRIYLLPLKRAEMANLYIDSVWTGVPVIRQGQIVDFYAGISNSGEKAAEEMPVVLSLNGKEVAVTTVTVPAEGRTTAKLTTRIVSEGIYHGAVTIDDHPVIFDDRYFLGTTVKQRRNVLSVYGEKEDPSLIRLFDADSLFAFDRQQATRINFSTLRNHDIIYIQGVREVSTGLQEALRSYVDGGGTLVMIPSDEPSEARAMNPLCNALGVATFEQTDTADVRVGGIDFAHLLYQGVYSETPANLSMPLVFSHHVLSLKGHPSETVIMKMLNDRPLLLSSRAGKGMVYQFATSFSSTMTTLASHADIFVPPLYNMALYSGLVQPLFLVIGADKSALIGYPDEIGQSVFRIRKLEGAPEFIPGYRSESYGALLFFEDQVTSAGNYQVLLEETEVAPLAFNFSHLESDLRSDGTQDLAKWVEENEYQHISLVSTTKKSVTERLQEMEEGTRLWRYFVMAALFFLLMETLLLRFWRNREQKMTT
jgi:hypothetical protein